MPAQKGLIIERILRERDSIGRHVVGNRGLVQPFRPNISGTFYADIVSTIGKPVN